MSYLLHVNKNHGYVNLVTNCKSELQVLAPLPKTNI